MQGITIIGFWTYLAIGGKQVKPPGKTHEVLREHIANWLHINENEQPVQGF